MSSAWKSGRGYVAHFRPLIPRTDGQPWRQRVPKHIWAGAADPLAVVRQWAQDAETMCRDLTAAPDAQLIEKARKHGAISDAQADALVQGMVAMPPNRGPAPTVEQAFLAHPNTTPKALRAYLPALLKWVTWAKSPLLSDMTFDRIIAYRNHLIAEGYAWDTRRHFLYPLRRAAKMAAARYGLPDVMSGFRLDKPGYFKPVQAWTFDEITRGFLYLRGDDRDLVAMSLGAFAGLRPSETVRIRCGDLRADNRLPIGLLPGRESEAKNHASRRLLPIPWPVAEAMHRLAKGRPANEPLLITRSPASDGPQGFTPIVFNQCFAPMMERVTGRRLPIKCLRKSFATWILRAGYDRERLELFLGHETKLANSITGRHYTAELHELLADELEPMAKGIGVAMEPYMFTQLPAEARS